MNGSKAWISGCIGQRLNADERAFFADERPWGFILFGRNIGEPSQVRDLVAELKDTRGGDDVPVLIDQEGGRVQRLRPPFAPRFPPAAEIGRVYGDDEAAGRRAAWLQGRLLADDLLTGYGINTNCIPCLDLPSPGSHSIIGDRAYGDRPAVVATLGRAAAAGLAAGGVLPVMKHIPGHGRAEADSHLELPTVRASRAELESHDFQPFAELADLPAGMTAHIRFEALDPDRPATLSPRVISEIIRGALGFGGLLMSDDMSMKALQGDMAELARAAIAAGCDLALHCNGDLAEMRAVASGVPELADESLRRAERARAVIRAGATVPATDAMRAEFAELLAATA
ncbi:beta-N-acetylhexosaminidase [Aureimonas flava]|uniref:beta-N-acetylhexosaminidase n=1 Tax=Aureimonas flava TaxID=2320271 RepID=A0A3A1WPV9_9HYPH|nr:beta-N-acetylhexosaminidase [Aureimonas flava]RIY03430.1 beta-N-acetylhexosaminidase [Aureimonas flava]